MKLNAIKNELGSYYPIYKRLKELQELDPVQARMEPIEIN